MESLGQYLKGLREEQHLTLEEVNRELKLSEEQITAIENNQLSKLGDYGFARATVYTYSRYLGADEKITFNLFDGLMPSRTQNSFKPHAPIKEKKGFDFRQFYLDYNHHHYCHYLERNYLDEL